MLRVYEDDGILLRNSNFFEFKNPIPKKIIEAKSGIQILDDTIKKVELTAYNHHIERVKNNGRKRNSTISGGYKA